MTSAKKALGSNKGERMFFHMSHKTPCSCELFKSYAVPNYTFCFLLLFFLGGDPWLLSSRCSINLQIRFLGSQWNECIQTLLVVTSCSKWYYHKISRLYLLQLRFYDFSEKVRKSASVEWVKAVSGLFYDGVGHSKSPATFWQRHTYLLPCQSPASVSITQSSSRGHGQNTNRNATYSTLQLNPIDL